MLARVVAIRNVVDLSFCLVLLVCLHAGDRVIPALDAEDERLRCDVLRCGVVLMVFAITYSLFLSPFPILVVVGGLSAFKVESRILNKYINTCLTTRY